MALPNPYAIDNEAIHRGSTLRVLAHAATEGQEGVLLADALKVQALTSAGAQVQVLPGPYVVLAKHTGGEYESYIGKVPSAELADVSPVGSSGARTDLVILRVENPYVPETSTWAQPPDPLNGPYAFVRVIEGVATNTSGVGSVNNGWSAIPLAKITRPANTSVVLAEHITNLRSTASLREVRIPDPTPPPPTPNQPPPPTPPAGTPVPPPPIAFETFLEIQACTAGDEHLSSQTSFHDFPNQTKWQVTTPAWAASVDVSVWITPQVRNGAVWGEMRFNLDGMVTSATVFDENPDGWIRPVMLVAGRIALPSNKRGKALLGKIETRSLDSGHPGKLIASAGCTAVLLLKFRKITS